MIMMSKNSTDKGFVSLLEKIDKQIINANNHLIKKNSNLDYWNLILKGLTMFRADVVDCKKELFKRSFVDKADNVDFEERFVLWNDVVKILGEVKK